MKKTILILLILILSTNVFSIPPSCPIGLTGFSDLCLSTRIPINGETVSFTVNNRSNIEGQIVSVYYGGIPDSNGTITNQELLTTGKTDSNGLFSFDFTIPNDVNVGTQYYFISTINDGNKTINTNIKGLSVIPSVNDADWIVTPNTYCKIDSNGNCNPINNSKPIEFSYNNAVSGDVILLEDGTYEHFKMNRGCHSQTGPIIWIMARNVNGAIIDYNPVGGSDTIEFTKQACFTSLVGLMIMGDDRATIMFSTSGNEPYKNIQILESSIEGGYDWYSGTGFDGKWGVQSYLLTGFLWRGGSIQNIKQEHSFYVHNSQDNFFVEDMTVKHVGRTAIQMTNRASDCDQYQIPCPSGKGNVQIRNVRVYDAGLGDFCAGGFALTFAGRNSFNILVEDTYIESGLDPALVAATGCLGTGELVVHAGGGAQNEKNGPIILRNSVFKVAPNEGNKDLSEFSYATSITFQNVTMNPGKRYGISISDPTDAMCFDRASVVDGDPEDRVRAFGVSYSNYDEMVDEFGECVAGVCGNNVCEAGEDKFSCPSDCIGFCGDGSIDSGEECDDGNNNNDDGCYSDCSLEYCGNNRIEGAEFCDGSDLGICTELCSIDCLCESFKDDDDSNSDDDSKDDDSGKGGGGGGGGGDDDFDEKKDEEDEEKSDEETDESTQLSETSSIPSIIPGVSNSEVFSFVQSFFNEFFDLINQFLKREPQLF